MELLEISGAAIAKQLASCKQSSRNHAVQLLCSWFPNQNVGPSPTGMLDSELIKIWKGLFFCVWHSDKPPTQLELINCLASLLSSLPPPLAGCYLKSFLITIRREWSGIDFLRLDKFYLLIRTFLRHVFIFLKQYSWNLDLTDRIVGILLQGSLLSVDGFPAAGINYHIAEIFLDEILDFLPLSKKTLDMMLDPFISVMQMTKDKALLSKIKVNIFDRLAVNGLNILNDAQAGSEAEKFGKIALAMGFSKRFFDLASATETQQGNRKVLFGLHDKYLKLDKEVKKLGLDISLENLDCGSLVRENACNMEATKNFTIGSSDIMKESCYGQVQKKRKKTKNVKPDLDGTGMDSKTKKKKKKSLGSSTENTAIYPGNMSKSKIKKQKRLADSSIKGNGARETISIPRAFANNENGKCISINSSEMISLDDTLLSNLQKQFEKVASEAGMANGLNTKSSKKRKHPKSADKQLSITNSECLYGECEEGKIAEMNAKKVRFSMNKNLIWKPQNPLPPQSLRLPPSVIPRGSALKKGLSPGPIRESPPTLKKIKVKGSSAKVRKALKRGSPAVKRLRLLHFLSA